MGIFCLKNDLNYCYFYYIFFINYIYYLYELLRFYPKLQSIITDFEISRFIYLVKGAKGAQANLRLKHKVEMINILS